MISLVGLGVTALLQLVVVIISGSVALLGDTLHNVADALTAVPLLIAFTLVRRPPTKKYTYGYGRAEDIGGLFVILMMLLSSRAGRLRGDLPVAAPAAGELSVGGGGRRPGGVSGQRDRRAVPDPRRPADRLGGVGRRRSARPHGRVHQPGRFVGAGGVAIGWRWADPVVGLLITVAILGVLRSAVRQVGARLMDAVDPELVDRATAAMLTVGGVTGVRELRIRWIGHTLRAV